MNTKTRRLIAILINAIIWAGIGWSNSDQTYAETAKVEVVADKTMYAIGEPIKATLAFENEGTIFQWGSYAWSIQKWEGDSWVLIERRKDPYFHCANIPECRNIDLNNVKECNLVFCERPIWYKVESVPQLEWDQSYKTDETNFQCAFVNRNPRDRNIVYSRDLRSQTCADFKQVSSGKYKIRFEYARGMSEFYDKRDIEIHYAEKEILIN